MGSPNRSVLTGFRSNSMMRVYIEEFVEIGYDESLRLPPLLLSG
jgi:hypothetical protein